MSKLNHIAIAGAGIAGLTFALANAKRGIKSTLFETSGTLEPIGAGIQLSPNACQLLFDLGLSSQINAYASAPRAIVVRNGGNGKAIQSIPLGSTAEKRYGAPYLVIHRGDLQKVLLEACSAAPQIKLELGHALGDFIATKESVTIKDQTFDALIGADGYRSAVRGFIGQDEPMESGLTAWRCTMPMDQKSALFERAATTLLLGKNAHLVTYPIASGTQLNAVAVLKNGTELESGFSNWCDEVKTLISTTEDWQPWPLFEAPHLTRWHKGNVAILGDAAHAMLPFAAQGGAMAIEDAATLADALAKHGTASGAFSNWAPDRQARTRQVAKLAQTNQRIYHLPFPLSTARNVGMKLLGGERLLARQDWIYGFVATPSKPNSSD